MAEALAVEGRSSPLRSPATKTEPGIGLEVGLTLCGIGNEARSRF